MITIAYIRCSTDKQDEASQRQIISNWASATKNEPDTWQADTASGAVPWQNRALAYALEHCAPGDKIVVSEISRIARSTVGVLTFLQAAAEKGITVIAIKSGINLDGSTASKIVVTVLAMAAEIERDLLRERTRGALAARKARGLPIGRQPGATGRSTKLSGKDAEIEKLLEARVAHTAIARIMGVSRGTLAAHLRITRSHQNDGLGDTAAATKNGRYVG